MEIGRIIVVGAGAMGSFFAARLAEIGENVSLVDVDDARMRTIVDDGLVIDDQKGSRVVRVPASRAEALHEPVDLIIMFTKGAHTAAASASIAHLVADHTIALTLQNGLGNAEAIAAVIPPERIFMGITDIPCDLVAPNSVSSHGHGHIVLGPYQDGETAIGMAIVDLLASAGLDASFDLAVRTAVWEKIAFNSAMNALCTVTTLSVGGLDNGPGRRLIAAIVAEVVAVATAMDIKVDLAAITAKIEHALANHVHHKPSMLQDRLAGRQTEIETINGAVVRAADTVDIPVPVNRTFADLVRTIEAASSAAT